MFQLLEVPAVDLTMSHPSIAEFGDGYYLSKAMMQSATDYYLTDPSQASHPYVSPLFAADLSGLPPAMVMTAEFDPLRDEGEAYGARLSEAGVAVDIHRGLGHIHGGQQLTGVWEPARRWAATADAALDAAFTSARR
jgi:acetyl esterase